MALTTAPENLPAAVLQQIGARGSAAVLRHKRRGLWQAISGAALGQRVASVALALHAAGFGRGDVAAMLAESRPEWVAADLGILAAGGVSAAIPPHCDAAWLAGVLRATGCRVAFVENAEQLDKLLGLRAACPALRRIVIFDMKGLRDFADPDCESFAAFLARGAPADAAAWQSMLRSITPDDPAVLVVAQDAAPQSLRPLTHRAVLAEVAAAHAMLRGAIGDERVVLLPSSDRLERLHGLYYALLHGVISNYPENQETVLENMQEVQPTLLGADPALWTAWHGRVARMVPAATLVQRMFYRGGIAAARRGGAPAMLARWLVLRQVRRELGLGRLRTAYLSDRPPPDVAAWAADLGIRIQRIAAEPSDASPAHRSLGAMAVEA